MQTKILIKAALHLHINLDPEDEISYDGFQAIDKAHQLGINLIAFTCHNKFIDPLEYESYAQKKGILLLSGIEKTIQKKHVLILNATSESEKIQTFKQLSTYKSQNPDCFIIAPHPYFYFPNCLKNQLIKHIDLFDAIEFNYFYHRFFNPNKKAIKVANQYKKPIIGTSDIHFLEFFNQTITQFEAESLTKQEVLKALKKNQLEVITKSFSLLELIKLTYKMLFIGKKNNVLSKQKSIS